MTFTELYAALRSRNRIVRIRAQAHVAGLQGPLRECWIEFCALRAR